MTQTPMRPTPMPTDRWLCRLLLALLLWVPALGHCAAVCEFDPHGQLVAPLPDGANGKDGWGGIGGTGVGTAQAGQPTGPVGVPPAQPDGWGGVGGTGVQSARSGQTPPPTGPDGWGGIGGTGIGTARVASTARLAGQVLFAGGHAEARRSGQPARNLANGDAVCEGDAIVTASGNSLLQIRLRDQGRVMLYASSTLRIDTFNLPATIDGSERLALSLERGGMRAMTGEIGHVNKANYLIRTPSAEIHIRGTDHEVFYVPPDKSLFGDVTPGTYNHVIRGGTTLTNAGGSVRIDPAQSAFAPFGSGEPLLIDNLPSALRALPLHGKAAALATAGKPAGSSVVSPADPITPLPNRIISHNVVIDPDSDTVQSPAASAYVGVTSAYGGITMGVIDGHSGSSAQIGTDPATGLPMYTVLDDGSMLFAVDYDTLQPVSYQSTQIDGATVYWGIYNGGAAADADGDWWYADLNAFAFSPAGSTPLSVIQSMHGSQVYQTIAGATAPIDEYGGQGGQVNSLSVGVTFGATPTIDSYAINVTDGQNRQWSAASGQAVPLSTFAGGNLQLSGSCAQCAGSTIGGTAGGVLIGAHAGGLITSYTLHSDQNESASGVAVLKP